MEVPEIQHETPYKEQNPEASSSKRKSHRKRKQKDPNAPTRPRSAYLLFLLDKNLEIRNKGGFDNKGAGSVAEVTRQVGAAWQKISDANRSVYAERAEEDKKRYEEEMRNYEKSDVYRKFKENQAKKGSHAEKAQRRSKKRQDSLSSSSTVEKQNHRNGFRKPSSQSQVKYSASPEISEPVPQKRFGAGLSSFLIQAPGMPNSDRLEELKIPIFSDDFIEWNTRREKELRRIRHLAHELEIDVAGLRTHSDQVSKFAEEAAETKYQLEQARAARTEISKILLEEFENYVLPSGLTIDEDNVEYFMTQVELFAHSKPNANAQQLQSKLRRVAPRLEQYMVHL